MFGFLVKQVGLAAVIFGLYFSVAHSQEYRCNSRLVEKTLDKSLSDRFGPTPTQHLQAMAATGEGVKMTFDRLDVQTIAAQPGKTICSARVRIWRQDTEETFDVNAQYTIIEQGDDAVVQLNSAARL